MFSFLSKEKKEAKARLRAAYEQYGYYSDEYIEAYLASTKRITSDVHYTLCEIYTEMERYDDAQKELLSCKSGSFMDDISTGLQAICKISLFFARQDYDEALSVYGDRVRFLDVHFKNPARSRVAGDYYMYAASLCAIAGRKDPDSLQKYEDLIKKYYARLREWCDVFPRHRLQFELTQTMVLFAKGENEEAEEAFAKCRQSILDHDFKYEWERENFLKRLERSRKLIPDQ